MVIDAWQARTYIVFMVNTKSESNKKVGGTFSVRLPESTRFQIDRLASMTKRSRSFVINEAVDAYVADRASYVAELAAAVTSARTGPTHSAEQIFGWMRSWGTETEMPSPEPDVVKRRK